MVAKMDPSWTGRGGIAPRPAGAERQPFDDPYETRPPPRLKTSQVVYWSGAKTLPSSAEPSSLSRAWVAWRTHQLRARWVRRSLFERLLDMRILAWDLAKFAELSLSGFPWHRAPVAGDRYCLLDLAIRAAKSVGLWMEFGVGAGDSINFIAGRSHAPIYGFDSFAGLPERWTPQILMGRYSTQGRLPTVAIEVTLVKGRFEDTLPGFLSSRPVDRVAFAHIDCDLYSSTRAVLGLLGPRVGPGTVFVFDEFCSGLLPDDECRAWREYSRSQQLRYEWLGASFDGSVAIVIQ